MPSSPSEGKAMFARYRDTPGGVPGVLAVALTLASISFTAAPANAFGLKPAAWGGMKDAIQDLRAAAGEDAEGREKSFLQERLERDFDRTVDKVADVAADKIEQVTLAAGKKGWDWLEKSKIFGRAAKKIAGRYGKAVRKGLRLAGPVGRVVDAWDTGYTIGEKVIASTIAVPLIDRYFENEWEKQEARFRREVAEIRNLGETGRRHMETATDMLAAGLAMRRLEGKRRNAAAADSDSSDNPWSERDSEADRGDGPRPRTGEAGRADYAPRHIQRSRSWDRTWDRDPKPADLASDYGRTGQAADRAAAAPPGCSSAWDDCRGGGYPAADAGRGRGQPGPTDRLARQEQGFEPIRRDSAPDHAADSDPAYRDAQRDYDDALAEIPETDSGPASTALASSVHRDYRSALDDLGTRERLEARAREQARMEAERAARMEEERQKRTPSHGKLAPPVEATKNVRPRGDTRLPARQAVSKSRPTGACATGPVCFRTAKAGERVVNPLLGLARSGRLSMTEQRLVLAFTAKVTIACMKVCIAREENRAHCKPALQNAIGELQKTYDSAIRSARSTSSSGSYVSQFEANPQNSPFGRKYLSQVRGDLDTCTFG